MTENGRVEVFWRPGCSSCLRLKEFVARSGIEYEEINVLEQPQRADKLTQLGLYTPSVCVDDECVSGTGLDAVAALIGIPYERPSMLTPAELVARYDVVLDIACGLIAELPPGGLEFCLPGRPRPMLDLANQAVSVIRGFLAAYKDGFHDRQYTQRPEHVRDVSDLLQRADETRQLVRTWWERSGYDDSLEAVIDTPWWGHRTLHEVLEREVWHAVQHTRQLQMALELLGVSPTRPLTEVELAGLELPEGIHG
jgi:glutaredoxin